MQPNNIDPSAPNARINSPQYNTEGNDNEIDIRDLVYIFLDKWYLFVISLIILTSLGYLYLKTQTPLYETKATVLVKTDQSGPEDMFLLEDLGLNMGKNNIENEIGAFKSPDLIAKIVTSLELHTTYRPYNRFGFHTPEMYRNSPIYMRMEDIEPERIPGTITFIVSPNGTAFSVEASFAVPGKIRKESITTKIDTLPAYIELPIGRFYIAKNPNREIDNTPIEVTISNAMAIARAYVNNLNITTTTKQSTLLDITLKTSNRQRGEDFVNAIISAYNQDAIRDKNIIAYNTSVFIDERLKDIARELGEVEGQVEEFRKEFKVADIQTQVGSYIRQSETYEARRMEIETQLNLVKFIDEFIKNPNNRNKLIPNLGIKDQGLVALINEYNNLLMNRERIESATAAENPALRQINQQVTNMYQNILTSLNNEKRASQIALTDLEREHTITSSRIQGVPTLDRKYTDILRQQEVKSNLFVYLLQKREESNLTQAAVAPKAKIIAKPFSGGAPVAPKKAMILALFSFFGLSIPAAILFIKDFFQTKITSMRDLDKLTNSTVIGDITYAQGVKGHSMVVKEDDQTIVSEMFRTMRNNLLFMTKERDHNIIMVTSTVPKEGKTFVSVNLAKILSMMDKKVLIVGADLRNPQISRAMGIAKREIGFSSYLAGHIEDYNHLIEKYDNNLYVVQSGPVPPNPNELLSKERAGIFFNNIRKEFDYIVVDSAPVGLVSDTLLISRYVHATIYVIRESYSQKDTLQFVNNLVDDRRLKNVGVVLNATTFQNKKGYYKYNYKYSYRYRYGYAQNYGR